MKGSLKNVALMALGLAAISPSPVQASKATNQQLQKEQITHKKSSAKEIIKQMAGGMSVMGFREGCPPHIYGQFHVRRGTHKRTNK